MTIVADASILIGLSMIGQLRLLYERFSEGVLIPEAVWQEVVEEGSGRPGAEEVANAEWITVQTVTDSSIVRLLLAELDKGEAEAIALAHETNADAVLLDERDARQAAMRLGLRPLGTIGVLIWAKKNGRLQDLQTMLDALQVKGGFRISRALYEQALREVGEQVT